jgi:hypothetical protein
MPGGLCGRRGSHRKVGCGEASRSGRAVAGRGSTTSGSWASCGWRGRSQRRGEGVVGADLTGHDRPPAGRGPIRRYDTAEELTTLNALYEQLRLMINYFVPQAKLISKTRAGANVTKR